MTLLISIFASIITTIIWYKKSAEGKKYQLGTLALMYWGASIMWFVDGIFEYAELKAEYFTPEPVDMLNDAFLGFSVIALGLIIWLIIFLIKDPENVIKSKFIKK